MERNILIVDDSESMRQLISYTLMGAGFKVLEAVDGKDALRKLNGTKVDMIISDLNMPKIDGLCLLKALRNHSAFRFIPIVMLTTEAQLEKVVEAKKAGVSGWIVKPFKPDKLVKVVKKFLK